MKSLSLGDLNLYYQDMGTGYPVVLVHGLGSDHKVWDGLVPLLKKEYRVIAVDLRGHGRSSKTPGPYSMELFAHDIHRFLESLEVDRAHFIGHSMGGVVLLELVLQYPEFFRSLTLISSFACVDSHLQNVLTELLQILNYQGYDAFFDKCLELTYTSKFVENNKDLFQEIKVIMAKTSSLHSLEDSITACLKVNLIDSLSKVKTPTMVIAGKEDVFTPPNHAVLIKNGICNSKIEIIDLVGHNLLVERPDNTYNIINSFLNGL